MNGFENQTFSPCGRHHICNVPVHFKQPLTAAWGTKAPPAAERRHGGEDVAWPPAPATAPWAPESSWQLNGPSPCQATSSLGCAVLLTGIDKATVTQRPTACRAGSPLDPTAQGLWQSSPGTCLHTQGGRARPAGRCTGSDSRSRDEKGDAWGDRLWDQGQGIFTAKTAGVGWTCNILTSTPSFLQRWALCSPASWTCKGPGAENMVILSESAVSIKHRVSKTSSENDMHCLIDNLTLLPC